MAQIIPHPPGCSATILKSAARVSFKYIAFRCHSVKRNRVQITREPSGIFWNESEKQR